MTAEVVILLRKNAKRLRTRAFGAFDSLRDDKKRTQDDCPVFFFGDPWENRTPVTAVKGRCLSRLTNGPVVAEIGLEPMTYRV